MTEYWGDRESIAEMHVVEELCNLARMGLDTIGEFQEFIRLLEAGDARVVGRAYEKLRSGIHSVEETKVMVMEYLVRLSIDGKDLYASLTLAVDKSVQKIDGAAYRLYMYIASGYTFKDELYGLIKDFVSKLVEEYRVFYNGLMKLRSDPRECIKAMNVVVKLEEELDNYYRSIELEMFKKLADNIPALMIMKDAMDFIEEVSDIIKEAGETLRYIALHKASLE